MPVPPLTYPPPLPTPLPMPSFVRDTTHVIVATDARGVVATRVMKLCQALAVGCWILAPAWLEACMEAGAWVPEQAFEVKASARIRVHAVAEKGWLRQDMVHLALVRHTTPPGPLLTPPPPPALRHDLPYAAHREMVAASAGPPGRASVRTGAAPACLRGAPSASSAKVV